MRFVGVLNRDGGLLRTTDPDALCREAARILAAQGHSLECRIVQGAHLREELERAVAVPGVGVLLAGGGDGTVSAAAEVALRAGVPLAVLPAGTMNLFARTLHLPLGLPEALRALAVAPIRHVDVASANGRVFVHQYSVGLHARLVRLREKLTYRGRYGKILASARAFLAAMVDPPSFLAEVRTPRGVERRYYSAIQVTANPVGAGPLPHPDGLERGRLGFYAAPPLTMRDTFQLVLDVLMGTWRANPFVSEREVRELTLSFPQRTSSAMATIDGELVPLPERVEIKVHPGALRVVAPAAAAAESQEPQVGRGP